MAIVINGSGTLSGLAVGGLPDGTVDTATLANTTVTAAKVAADVATQAEIDAKLNLAGGTVTGDLKISTLIGGTEATNELGIGVTPGTIKQGSWSALRVGGQVVLQGITSESPSGEMELGYNVYRHTDGANRNIATGKGAKLYMSNGGIIMYVSNGSQNANTSYTLREGLNISNTGNVNIGSSTATQGTLNAKGYEQKACDFRRYNSTGEVVHFEYNNGTVGSISVTGSNTAYNTSSDYRLKENVDYTWDATTRLKQLKPARFNFISDDTNTLVDGFIAHEVSSVVPEAITGAKDAMTTEVLYVEDDELPEGKSVGDVKEASAIDPQGIDQSKLVPLLVKTIQELEARITALEA